MVRGTISEHGGLRKVLIPGTTPLHEFEIPVDTALLKEVKIIYAQNDEQIFSKKATDCNFDGHFIRVKLTQEETFSVDCRYVVQIQIRALTHSGDVLGTEEPILVSAAKCLDKEKEVLA